MDRLEKIEQEAQKARERIAAMQALLKDIEGKRTEQENLQIVRQVRALKLTREELYAFIKGGEIPGIFAGAVTGADDYAPEPKHSRRKGRHDGEPATDTETADDNAQGCETSYAATNDESECINHEEQ